MARQTQCPNSCTGRRQAARLPKRDWVLAAGPAACAWAAAGLLARVGPLAYWARRRLVGAHCCCCLVPACVVESV